MDGDINRGQLKCQPRQSTSARHLSHRATVTGRCRAFFSGDPGKIASSETLQVAGTRTWDIVALVAVQKLLPLVMTLVVIATPVSAELCRMSCAAVATPVVEHSCHHHQSAASASGKGARVTPAPHVCGHDEAGSTALTFSASLVAVPVRSVHVDAFRSRPSGIVFGLPAQVSIPPPILTSRLRV
jgi:hypothetical protein